MRSEEEARAAKLAMNQSVFRTANEQLRRAAASYHFTADQRVPFVCECADPECQEIVMLSLSEYERVRDHATWFLLVAGHEDSEATHERIIEAEAGYAIVEKIGTAGKEATRLYSRRRTT
jgi:hypothetical protein